MNCFRFLGQVLAILCCFSEFISVHGRNGNCPNSKLHHKAKKCYRFFVRAQNTIIAKPLYIGQKAGLDELRQLCSYQRQAGVCIDNLRSRCQPYRYAAINAAESSVPKLVGLCDRSTEGQSAIDEYEMNHVCMEKARLREGHDPCYTRVASSIKKRLIHKARNDDEKKLKTLCGYIFDYKQCVAKRIQKQCGARSANLASKLASSTLVIRYRKHKLHEVLRRCSAEKEVNLRNYKEYQQSTGNAKREWWNAEHRDQRLSINKRRSVTDDTDVTHSGCVGISVINRTFLPCVLAAATSLLYISEIICLLFKCQVFQANHS